MKISDGELKTKYISQGKLGSIGVYNKKKCMYGTWADMPSIFKFPNQKFGSLLFAQILIIIIISLCNTCSCTQRFSETVGPMIFACGMVIDLYI